MGDFNIVVNKSGPHQVKFTFLMEEHCVVSVHSEATTDKGNLLDLYFMKKDVTFGLNIDKTMPSDHYAITFNVVIEKVNRQKFYRDMYA